MFSLKNSNLKKRIPINQGRASLGRHQLPMRRPWTSSFRCWGRCRDLKRAFFLRPHDLSLNVTLDVKITKLLTSKWPNFWCLNDQTFDVRLTKLLPSKWPNYFYVIILHLTTDQRLIYYLCQTSMRPVWDQYETS